MNTEYEKAVDAMKKDIKDLRDDMKDVVAAIKAKAGTYVDETKESLHESAAQRIGQLRDAADAIGKRCRDGVKGCTTKIEEHPFTTLLAALGVGVVLGGLLRRRRS